MEDLIRSIKAFLYDRATSPLFGSFITSWIICNYRIFIIIFSDSKPQVKLSLIDQIHSQVMFFYTYPISRLYIDGFIYPILLCLSYLYLYPLLAEPVYKFTLGRQKRLSALKQEIEESRLLTLAESTELIRKHNEIQAAFDQATLSHRQKIQKMNEIIEELRSRNLIEKTDNSNKQKETRELLETLINKIGNLPDGEYSYSELIQHSEITDNHDRYLRQELKSTFTKYIKMRKHPDFRCYTKNNNSICFIKSNQFEKTLTSELESVLKALSNDGQQSYFSPKEIQDTTNISDIRLQVAIDELNNKNLISKSKSPEGDDVFILTFKGKNIWSKMISSLNMLNNILVLDCYVNPQSKNFGTEENLEKNGFHLEY